MKLLRIPKVLRSPEFPGQDQNKEHGGESNFVAGGISHFSITRGNR